MIRAEQTVACAATIDDLLRTVRDFDSYPEFIPELTRATVLDQTEDWVIVEHEARVLPGARYTLKYEIPRTRDGLRWSLVGGLFHQLEGEWRFQSQGKAATLATFGCGINLPKIPALLQRPILDAAVATLVRRFRQRAEERLLREGPQRLQRELGRAPASDGLSLAYEWLSGPSALPLVYCNGMLQDTSCWTAVVRELRPVHPQLHWDYRGFGGSDVHKVIGTLTQDQHCNDLEKVLDTIGLERAVFLGHSMGAQVILEFQNRFPERVAALIPICGTFQDPFSTLFDLPHLRGAWLALVTGMAKAHRLVDPSWRAFVATSMGREVVLRLATNRRLIRDPDAQGFLANFGRWDARSLAVSVRALSEHSAGTHLERIAVPTLVIAGEKDRLTSVARSKEMAAQIPGAELFVIPHGSHLALLEQPELVALRIEKFLRQVS
jgi:pimeloyl-ACP methyl ester carboxylesterase/ribosome-associated toxin RatA of RatAB toxin-antitoxin module